MNNTHSPHRRPDAFGHPGIPPTWTASAKDMVGCALGPARLWFTIGHGILNEVYYPRADVPQIRDMGFTKLVRRDDGVYENVTRSGTESRYVRAGESDTLPHFHKKISD